MAIVVDRHLAVGRHGDVIGGEAGARTAGAEPEPVVVVVGDAAEVGARVDSERLEIGSCLISGAAKFLLA